MIKPQVKFITLPPGLDPEKKDKYINDQITRFIDGEDGARKGYGHIEPHQHIAIQVFSPELVALVFKSRNGAKVESPRDYLNGGSKRVVAESPSSERTEGSLASGSVSNKKILSPSKRTSSSK